MKKIIFILALFVSFVANSQYTPPTGYTNINARYDWLAGVFRALGLPAGGNAAFTTGQAQRAGSVYYDSTGVDAGLKVWNGTAWVGVGEVTQSALDDTAAAIRSDHWAVRGNAIAQDTSKFIGTTDSSEVALRFRINNYNAGYLGFSYQTSNPPYTNDGNNYTGMVALGYRAGDSLRKLMDGGTTVGTNSVAIGADALRDNSVAQNTAIGNNAMKRARTMARNTIIGQGAMQYAYTGDFNVGLGTFVMEVQDGVSGNTGVGTFALRGNKMGSGNASTGYLSSAFGTTVVESLTITNGGSGYTTATITISAPETATPGTLSINATATAVISGGAIIGATMTDLGSGYSSTKTPVTVTITGDGTGATATAVLKSGANNTVNGYQGSFFNRSGSRQTVMGTNANYGTVGNHRGINDDDITLIGYNATRGTGRSPGTVYKYSTAIGSNATFECDSCFILGTTFTRTGTGTNNPNASAQLDVTSTTRGFLPPRMSAAQRVAIASPATSLFVWDIDSARYMGYNGSTYKGIAWTDESGGGGGGSGTVNSGTQYRLAYYAATGDAVSEAPAITASRALVSDANGVPTHSTTTAAEIAHVSGVTSAIQTQLDGKIDGTLTATRVPFSSDANTLTDAAELIWDNTGKELRVGGGSDVGAFPLQVYKSANPIFSLHNGTQFTNLFTGSSLSIFQFPAALKFGIQAASSITDNGTTGLYSIITNGSSGSYNTVVGGVAYNTTANARLDVRGDIEATSKITLAEIAAPSTPSSGKTVIYPKSDGLWYGKDDAGVETKLSNEITTTGNYSPTLTNVTNLTTSSSVGGKWFRVGDMVTWTGRVDVVPAAAGLIELRLTLPVASALVNEYDLTGNATNQDNKSGHIAGDETNDAAYFRWIAPGTGTVAFRVSFTYQVL